MKKLAMMVSAVLAWMGAAQWAAAQSKPNVILIMTDQQRGDAMGCAGKLQTRSKTVLYSPNYPKPAKR